MVKQIKIACINDISGIGKCSLTVALPILSSLKCQCCPITTAVLSCQTGYPRYTFRDLTSDLDEYIDVLKYLNVGFDGIYSGFLGSKKQADYVLKLINNNPSSFVIVDPVLGDNGKIYSIFDNEFIQSMRDLVSRADLITPNITEANILLGNNTNFFDYDDKQLKNICKLLSQIGPKYVVITGFIRNNTIYNICYDADKDCINMVGSDYNNISFSGTGDIFTSIISGLIMRGYDLYSAVSIATKFIKKTVDYTSSQPKYDRNDGIMFEYFLGDLVIL